MSTPRRWPAAVLGFGLGVLVTAGAGAGLYYALVLRVPPGTATDPDRPVFPRPEFSRLVDGKPEAEVVKAVGPPDSTSEDPDGKFWHYKYRTRDPLTGDLDTDVQVIVRGGKVVAINY